MMKFFRKHNKKLLAVFMVLLMVVFLGGSALDTMLRPSGDRVVATSTVGDISYTDQRSAEVTTEGVLAFLGLNWQRPFPGAREPLDTIDWILVTREAEALGFAINTAEARSLFGDVAALNRLAQNIHVRPVRILDAVAQFNAIQRLMFTIGGSATPSEAEIQTAARNALEKAKITAVLLPAAAFVDEEAEFTEAQIEVQFAAYREREAGPGLEFGYYVEPSLKLQYIQIDENAIKEELLEAKAKYMQKKAKAYFKKNRETDRAFRRPPEVTAPDAETAGEELTEGPVQEKPPYLAWDEAREAALDIVAKIEASQAADRLADWLVNRLKEDWLGAKLGEDGYYEAPASAARLEHYAKILELVPKTIAYPGAVSVNVTDFFNEDEATNLPLLGTASFRPERGVTQWLRQLAFRTEAIVPQIPKDRGARESDYSATFQTSPYPLKDEQGKTFVFRVIDAREGHVPKSVEEVREQVVEDLRLAQGFETAKARAESLRSCAGAMSLAEAYESDEELVALRSNETGFSSGYFEPPEFARMARYDAEAGTRPKRTFLPGGIGPVDSEVIDTCFALEEADEKTAVIELKVRATVMVASWLETVRAQDDEFREMRESFVQQMDRARSQAVIADWLDPEKIRARNGFKIVEN